MFGLRVLNQEKSCRVKARQLSLSGLAFKIEEKMGGSW